jgi:hypothetical protein
MESAQTGHVGKSLPRGLRDTVDRTSAIADIVASLCDVSVTTPYNNLFDDVATQMRWFYVIRRGTHFCDAANCGAEMLERRRAFSSIKN